MARRRGIHIEGFSHSNPIPVATRLGPLLVSSLIVGKDPATGEVPDGIAEQCRHIFRHVSAMLEAAGATPDDVVKMDFWVPDPAQGRAIINEEWRRLFPDPGSAPARHTHPGVAGERWVRAEFTAYITD